MDRLRPRVFALVAGSLAVTAVSLTWWATASFARAAREEFRLRGMVLARTFLHEGTLALERGDGSAAQPFLDSLLADPDVAEAHLLDAAGRVVASKWRSGAVRGAFKPDARLAAAAAAAFTPQFGDTAEGGRRILSVYQRVWSESPRGIRTLGLCVLKLGTWRVDRQAQAMARALGAVAAAFTLLAGLLGYRFAAALARPLERLRAAAEAVGRGDAAAPLPTAAAGEIGALARAFEAMAAQVRTARETLESRVEERTRELARSNAELENYAAIASHDLRAPLRHVAGFADLLARRARGRLEPEELDMLGRIQGSAARMGELISDILEYSRAGAPGRPPVPVDASRAVDQAVAVLGPAVAEAGAFVTRDQLPTVLGDEGQLARLFENLIGNALKFRGDEPSRVHVSAERDGPRWRFRVKDNGVGIPPADKERVFHLFVRLPSSSRREGSGIGLAVCRRIVERHGGRIWVEEGGPGAALCFTLPAA